MATCVTCQTGVWSLGLLVLAAGCDRGKVEVYNIPKDGTVDMSVPASDAGSDAGIRWQVPKGWTSLPPTEMRIGNFRAGGAEANAVDISVTKLPAMAAGDLENVNRWRGQIGLAPLASEEELAKLTQEVPIGDRKGHLFDLQGEATADSVAKKRIIAATLNDAGQIWFFKMTGEDSAVGDQRPAFRDFLHSIVLGPSATAATAPAPAPAMAMPTLPGAESASGNLPKWDVPAGWQQQGPAPMVLTSFSVTGDNGAAAVVSVTQLSGSGGDTLANVNRWRNQLGLPAVDESQLPAQITTLDLNGAKAILTDMTGKDMRHGGVDARMVAMIVPQGDSTWFYKLIGTPALVEQQKQAFQKFVQSAHYN